jgi:hypothetical protein
MALSDTCSDALYELQNDFVGYADWNYKPSELSRIVNAMYELAEFMIRQDVSPHAKLEHLEEIIDGAVVARIFDIADEEGVNEVCGVIAKVAKENTRLAKSIQSMRAALTAKENLFDAIKAARLLEQLNEVDKIMKE